MLNSFPKKELKRTIFPENKGKTTPEIFQVLNEFFHYSKTYYFQLNLLAGRKTTDIFYSGQIRNGNHSGNVQQLITTSHCVRTLFVTLSPLSKQNALEQVFCNP